jgi:putative tricarboxylic transport membrane protein
MRIVFLLALLGGAIFYSYIAFFDLTFLTRTGRIGPGFFPRLVGGAMIVTTLWAIVDALRDRRAMAEGAAAGPNDAPSGLWRDVIVLMLLVLGYAVMLRLFGGFVSTVLYLGLALIIFNPGRHLQNALVAVIFPGVVYLSFDRLLNANMPPALFTLPF